MNAPATLSVASPGTTFPSVPQHADQTFPHVLVISTAGAFLVLASIWLTALALA
jgi:hypothetical protein